MATSYTGLRVQDTYNAIIKIGDNSNLTGTPKLLSDGLGNDSPLYLSGTRLGIGISPAYQFHTSGNAKIGGNLIISGNLTVNGTLTYLNVTDLAVEDPLIKLAKDNTANTLDIGLFGKYVATGTKYKGFFNDASDNKFKLFIGTSIEPTTTVDTSASGYTKGNLVIGNLEATGGDFSGTVSINDAANAAWLASFTNTSDSGHGLIIQAGGTSGTRYITQWYDAAGTERFHMDDTGEAYFQNSITTPNIYLSNTTNPTIFFNGTSDSSIDMAIKATPEGLDFYEPEQSNKVHFQILDDTGVNAPYGYRLNGVMVIDASRNLTNIGTGNFSGQVTIPETPTADAHAASKKYVDDSVPTEIEVAKRIDVTVKNVSGGELAKGVVVHAAPTATPPSGNVIEVVPADANVVASMPAIGVLNETIADEAEGQAVMFGAVSGINTSSFSIGDELYVSETAGEFTATKPTAFSSQVQKIAVVIKSHASNGLIKVFGAGRANDIPNRVNRDMNFTDDSELTFGDSSDLKIYHTTNNIVRINSGDLIFNSFVTDGDIKFQLDNGSGSVTEYMRLDGGEVKTIFTKSTRHNDNVKALFGTDSDLEIYHNGTDGYIDNINGALVIQNNGNDKSIIFKTDNGIGGITEYFKIDGNINRNVITATTQIGDNTAFIFGSGAGRPSIKYDSTASQLFISGESKFLNDLLVVGNQKIGNTLIEADRVLKIQTAAEYNTELQLRESTDNYGFTLRYNGTANQFKVIRHDNSATGVDVITIGRGANTVAFSGGITMGGVIDMVNQNINNINSLYFNDAGGYEGINWNGGNLWRIFESPNDLSNASGNLQFVKDTTRSMTLDTSGNLYTLGGITTDGSLTVTSDAGITIRTTTTSVGAKINFSDDIADPIQQGTLYFAHADNTSIGSGAAFHFDSTETEVSVVSGDATSSGNFLSYSRASTAEVDFGFVADLNTGMYRPANHQLGFVVNSSRKIQLTSDGVFIQNGSLYVQSGTAAVPSLQIGDTDTGFYDAGANVIGISTGGVAQATFGSSPNGTIPLRVFGSGATIGGTTMANSTLLVGTTSVGIGIDSNEIMNVGDHFYFGTSGADKDIVFRTQGSVKQMRLLHSGELCLGTDNSSAGALLSIKTPAVADGGTLGAPILQLVGTSETTSTSGVVTPTNGIIFKPAMPAGYGDDGYNTVLEQQSGGTRTFYFRTSGASHLSIDVEHNVVLGGSVLIGATQVIQLQDTNNQLQTGFFKSGGNMTLMIDSNNNGVGNVFSLKHNGQSSTTGSNLMTINDSGNMDLQGYIICDNNVIIDGVDAAGNVTGTDDQLRVTGYGIMGNRAGNVYITNGNTAASASIVFGVRAAHNGNNRLIINDNTSTFYTDITASDHNILATGGTVRSQHDSTHYVQLESNSSGGVVKGVGGAGFMIRSYGDTYFNGGNFGIGDNVVTYPFTVGKSVTGLISRIYNSSTSGQGVLIRAGEETVQTRILQASSRTDVKRFTVNSDGTVGVNIANPAATLDIQNKSIGTSTVNTTVRIGGVGGNESSTLQLAESLSGSAMNYGFQLKNRGNIDNTFQLTTHDNSTTGVVSLQIARSTGNVGIKGASGAEELQVNGNMFLTNNSYIGFNTSASSGHPKISMDSLGAFSFTNTANLVGLKINNSGTVDLNNGTGQTVLVKGGTMNFGIPGNGANVNGRFCTIEGNTGTDGEASGRIFFAEHNSTTGAKNAYGMSLGYRGGGTSLPSGVNGLLTQIGNGEWGMWGHNNVDNGTLIMSGTRSASTLKLLTNLVETKAVNQRVKISVWSGSTYGFGMQTTHTFGGLNGYAITCQMSNTSARGFWWGDTGHTNSQGAFACTTQGKFTIAHSLRLGYGEGDTTLPGSTYKLDVSGDIRATSDVIAFSDRRVKENIVTVDNALDKVTQLRGVTYTRKDIDDKSTKIGVIAQEVLEVLPEVVSIDDEDKHSVAYGNMAGVFIEAIKELKAEVDSLKKEIKQLKK